MIEARKCNVCVVKTHLKKVGIFAKNSRIIEMFLLSTVTVQTYETQNFYMYFLLKIIGHIQNDQEM